MYKLSDSNKNAAIAQPVERILGKDEVASSNLASSSKKSVIPTGMADFLSLRPDLKVQSQGSGGALLPPVQTLVASSIFILR